MQYILYLCYIYMFRYNSIVKIPNSVIKVLMKLEKD